jgi:hypothetical protein
MARSKPSNRNRTHRHAPHQNHAPTSRRNSTASMYRCYHMGVEVVLLARSSAVLCYCPRHGLDGQQHPAAVSEVLGRAASAAVTAEGESAARGQTADRGKVFGW